MSDFFKGVAFWTLVLFFSLGIVTGFYIGQWEAYIIFQKELPKNAIIELRNNPIIKMHRWSDPKDYKILDAYDRKIKVQKFNEMEKELNSTK